jgi:hypothetical protein
MSVEQGSFESPKYDFEAIEAAVRETERGRWFLSEYERRSRGGEIRSVLDAISKFEGLIKADAQGKASTQLSHSLAEAVARTKAEVEAVTLKVFPLPTAAPRSSAFGHLAVQANAIAAELTQLGQVMQLTAESFRDDQEGMAGAVNHLSQRLLDIAGLQNAITSGVDMAVRLLERLDRESTSEHQNSSFGSQLQMLAADLPRMREALSEENCQYFGKDEELFAEKEKVGSIAPTAPLSILSNPPAPAPEESGKARIVVVRTPSSATIPIPLADGTQDTAA